MAKSMIRAGIGWRVVGLGLAIAMGWAEAGAGTDPLADAGAAYSNLEFEKALDLLETALSQPNNERDRLVRIYHLQGLCLATLGKRAEAKAAFLKLLSLDPAFRLGTDVAPKVRAPFEEVANQGIQRLEARLAPPATVKEGEPLEMTLAALPDPAGLAVGLHIAVRRAGGAFGAFQVGPPFGKQKVISVPQAFWSSGKGAVQWYAWLQGKNDAVLQRLGDRAHPMSIVVVPRDQGLAAAAKAEVPAVAAPWYQKWWVWAIAGGVIAGGVTAAVLASRGSGGGPINFGVEFGTVQP